MSEAAAADGPILECGSGLTTTLAAIYSRHDVWSLEHLPYWHRRLTSELRRNRLQGAHVSLTSLRRYEDFDWYSVDRMPLPPSFALVICDGPPGETRGGRVGLFPVMGSRISSAVVLLDDANRPGEAAVMEAWNRRYGVSVERPAGTRYAVVRSAALPSKLTLGAGMLDEAGGVGDAWCLTWRLRERGRRALRRPSLSVSSRS